MDLQKKVKNFPDSCGVYIMKDRAGKIIYIGKATSLKKRLSSYFQKYPKAIKSEVLISRVTDIGYLSTASEIEALLLEAELIKEHKPKYNVQLRDDKSFPLVKITKEKFPLIFICRPRIKNKSARYFGPYTNVKLLRKALKAIRFIFPYRSCYNLPKNACLNYHLNLCPAPCISKITPAAYKKNIKNIILFLQGRRGELIRSLYNRMQQMAKQNKFEEAAGIRDKIQALEAIYLDKKITYPRQQLQALRQVLALKTLPRRIEAFDISDISGAESVGSMVSFYAGNPDKNNYRRFRIKTVSGINDYGFLAEVINRRYKRVKEEGLEKPDLIVVDGGRGQILAAQEELNKLNLDIPLISIAKLNEEIYFTNKTRPLRLPFESPALQLIRRVRDEAHRFALKYHHLLRRKRLIGK